MATTTAASTFVKSLSAKNSSFKGSELKKAAVVAPVSKTVKITASSDDKVEMATRRSALGLFAGAAMTMAAKPSYAAYGQGANIFGSTSNTTGFYTYAGDGYALLIPAKFGPSKEREFPGADARWEDNYRVANNIIVTRNPTGKGKIEDFGSPEEFIGQIANMLGTNSWQGESQSEGGFDPNTVSSAALLATNTSSKKGKTYYEIEMLVRTADGDEGGRHQLFSATVSNGQLYVVKVQSGDKSWFKGGELPSREVIKSFQVV
eukprot:CAMPEP_0197845876 /NCGR_PEP_ID=MMETSP1438-20131217/2731_1 /TAXON_ID=1461541 /ORGANISM="Pterosperma sp., Strain CCMP1384" /LENGTH=261 /DNA_ID=CAMNT_0043457333 /DNA_START=1055 /DNA_END=1840 /DNA_ORIENTATION=+